ncbi:MAG: RND transporter, partial [Desulfuromonadaceae bacterium]|nr:RND transporter [Desulfuromonadaceae bacterium]
MKHTGLSIRIIMAVCLLPAAGCMVGPDYVRPAAVATMPATFKEQAGWKVAQPGDVRMGERWWELYRDPVLNSLEREVAISNLNVAAAEARFRQARAVVQSARSGYYPTLS